MTWGKAGSTTLSSAGDAMTISGMTANDSYVYLFHAPANGSYNTIINFDNDSGTKYTERKSANGGADSTAVSQTDFNTGDGTNSDGFHFGYIVDVSGEETLIIDWWNRANTAGAGNAPYRGENVGKFTGTTQFTRIDFDNSSGGSGFATDTNLTALGSEITPVAAVSFPTNVPIGSRAEITDTRKIYYRMDSDYVTDKWFEVGTLPYAGGRGVFAGGYDGSNYNKIEYITISTTGNTTDFGDLTRAVRNGAVCANKTRGIYCGGYDSSYSDDIDYITIATPSNATTFGTFGDTQTNGMMGIGSETRALFGGGETSMTNRIDYLTIATPSNSTSFGTLSVSRKGGGTTGDGTKGIFMGGEEGGQHGTTMDYVTIDANPTVTATDWGDLDIGTASASVGVISNGTIGLLAVGVGYSNRVDKKTIATNANSSDYGDLTVGRQQGAQCSTETRGVFGGGKTASGSNYTNTIDYMTIANGGTATDFGDLSNARYILGGMSDTGAVRS